MNGKVTKSIVDDFLNTETINHNPDPQFKF
jgi:hypothetical protein